jgi:hypothetical protein
LTTPIKRRKTGEHIMTTHNRRRMIAGALMSASLAVAGLGLSVGTAEAGTQPDGPFSWCPGDPPVETGNKKYNPVRWDEGICHEYWLVYHGQGNVAQNVWDGPNPPGPPPGMGFAPPPPLPPGWCWGLFLPGPCPPGVVGPRLG